MNDLIFLCYHQFYILLNFNKWSNKTIFSNLHSYKLTGSTILTLSPNLTFFIETFFFINHINFMKFLDLYSQDKPILNKINKDINKIIKNSEFYNW